MGAVTIRPITIEEFDKLDLAPDQEWELHNGEIVGMSHPSIIHRYLQDRMCNLLRQALPDAAVLVEYSFQIESTNDKRSADIGLTTKERDQVARKVGSLSGAPELVVEVLSPSNTVVALRKYRRLCFKYGTKIFLLVGPEDNSVEVYFEPEKADAFLKVGDTLRISLLGREATIPVAAIFAGITLPET